MGVKIGAAIGGALKLLLPIEDEQGKRAQRPASSAE